MYSSVISGFPSPQAQLLPHYRYTTAGGSSAWHSVLSLNARLCAWNKMHECLRPYIYISDKSRVVILLTTQSCRGVFLRGIKPFASPVLQRRFVLVKPSFSNSISGCSSGVLNRSAQQNHCNISVDAPLFGFGLATVCIPQPR